MAMSDPALRQHLAEARERLERGGGPGDTPDDLAERVSAIEDLMARNREARWSAAIPSRFAWARLVDFESAQINPVLDWCERPDGRNLVVGGDIGTGKTHLAVAACRPLLERGLDILFTPLVELLDMLRPGGDPNAFEELSQVDVLVLDDLGAERPTDWTAERLYAVVNRRWLEERPTVATTNLKATDLEAACGPRVYSRLVGNGAVLLRLGGGDRRREA